MTGEDSAEGMEDLGDGSADALSGDICGLLLPRGDFNASTTGLPAGGKGGVTAEPVGVTTLLEDDEVPADSKAHTPNPPSIEYVTKHVGDDTDSMPTTVLECPRYQYNRVGCSIVDDTDDVINRRKESPMEPSCPLSLD